MRRIVTVASLIGLPGTALAGAHMAIDQGAPGMDLLIPFVADLPEALPPEVRFACNGLVQGPTYTAQDGHTMLVSVHIAKDAPLGECVVSGIGFSSPFEIVKPVPMPQDGDPTDGDGVRDGVITIGAEARSPSGVVVWTKVNLNPSDRLVFLATDSKGGTPANGVLPVTVLVDGDGSLLGVVDVNGASTEKSKPTGANGGPGGGGGAGGSPYLEFELLPLPTPRMIGGGGGGGRGYAGGATKGLGYSGPADGPGGDGIMSGTGGASPSVAPESLTGSCADKLFREFTIAGAAAGSGSYRPASAPGAIQTVGFHDDCRGVISFKTLTTQPACGGVGSSNGPCDTPRGPAGTYDLAALAGGGGGGAGSGPICVPNIGYCPPADPTWIGGPGGGGGGAIAFIANGTLDVEGKMFANGGEGGEPGKGLPQSPQYTVVMDGLSGGGGAGGAIVLAGRPLKAGAGLFVHGGKGGPGGPEAQHGREGGEGWVRLDGFAGKPPPLETGPSGGSGNMYANAPFVSDHRNWTVKVSEAASWRIYGDGVVVAHGDLTGADTVDVSAYTDGVRHRWVFQLFDGEVPLHNGGVAIVDDDLDGLCIDQERGYGTSDVDADSDGDFVNDPDEVVGAAGVPGSGDETDPADPDSDGDGLVDGLEAAVWGTLPYEADSDFDGVIDGDEVFFWRSDPLNDDSDFDGVIDGDEVDNGTDPLRADTDEDGLTDDFDPAPTVGCPDATPHVAWYGDTDADGFGGGSVIFATCPNLASPVPGTVANGLDCDDEDETEGPPSIKVYADLDSDSVGGAFLRLQCFPVNANNEVATGDLDCDDLNPAVHPGEIEYCDGLDQDCDGQVDDGVPLGTWYPDGDGDGVGVAQGAIVACAQPAGTASIAGDCNDFDPNVSCADEDVDGDGFCPAPVCADPDVDPGDCDDTNAFIKPGAIEVCDGGDDNCDGFADEGLSDDLDGDGHTDLFGCTPGDDCDDFAPFVYQGAPELCNGLDDDCDAVRDDGLVRDDDGDGWLAGCVASYLADCDDTNPNTHPHSIETVTNGRDDDCDGFVDEGDRHDDDGDGFCESPFGCDDGSLPNDCNDGAANMHPGAYEVPDNHIDDDCDGTTDESSTEDLDDDGYTAAQGDCNDHLADVHPGATELCDGLDGDCNGFVPVDELDRDGDTWRPCDLDGEGDCDDRDRRAHAFAAEDCADGIDNDCDGTIDVDSDLDNDGSTTCGGDCRDNDASVRPGVPEVCNNIDDNCNGRTDETADRDGDGFIACDTPCSPEPPPRCDCDDTTAFVRPGLPEDCNTPEDNNCDSTEEDVDLDLDGWSSCTGDCDDDNGGISPGTAEVCNGIDDDCDGSVDEGFDADRDGVTACTGDCDDTNPFINTFEIELCDNGIDEDCTGAPDDGPDLDHDGYIACDGSDCDDNDALIHKDAEEICDGKDTNCNGTIEDDLDQDLDGFTACTGDCDDTDRERNPDHAEVCNNGLDDDCNGLIDDGEFDADGDGFTECTGDCDDANPDAFPGEGRSEADAGDDACGNGIDDDCDGRRDWDDLDDCPLDVPNKWFCATNPASGPGGLFPLLAMAALGLVRRRRA